MEYEFRPRGVCSTRIRFELDQDNKIHNVRFDGGCNGNLKAIGKLVEGQDARWVADTLAGNTCGFRNTSCGDQFSKALIQAMEA